MSIDSLRAAQVLHTNGHARSAASRAYFAAYAAVTSKVADEMSFADGRSNPPHAVLSQVTQHNATKNLNISERKEAARIVRMLQAARLTADYGPGYTVDEITSLQSVKEATRLLQMLEVA
jgi:uncharacterized protein (UPF0332 family)